MRSISIDLLSEEQNEPSLWAATIYLFQTTIHFRRITPRSISISITSLSRERDVPAYTRTRFDGKPRYKIPRPMRRPMAPSLARLLIYS